MGYGREISPTWWVALIMCKWVDKTSQPTEYRILWENVFWVFLAELLHHSFWEV